MGDQSLPSSDGDDPPSSANIKVLGVFAAFALVALFVYLMVIAEAILLPLALAVFIVLLLDSIGARLCRIEIAGRRLPEWAGMLIAVILLLGAFVALANLIRGNVAAVGAAVPTYEENIRALLEKGLRFVGAEELPTFRDVINEIDIRGTLAGVVGALASVTGNVLTVTFYVIFILLEQATFGGKIKRLFSKTEDRRRAKEMISRVAKDIQTYIGLKTFVSAITGILSYLVMFFVGVDFAAFWAVLIFILNFIPYIGSLVGVVFPALLTLVQFDTPGPFIITTTVLAAVQLFVGNVIEPRLMGRSLNLSPLVILLSLAIFGQIWGIVGMVLSMPFMVIAMIVCAGFEATRPVAILMSATGRVGQTGAEVGDDPETGAESRSGSTPST